MFWRIPFRMKVRWRRDIHKMLGRNILSQFLQTLDKISLGWAWGSGQDQGGCREEDPGNYVKNLKQAFRDGHTQMSWEEQNKSHTLKRVSEVTGEPRKLRDQRENEDLGEVCPKIKREVVSQRLSAWTGNSEDQMLAFPLPFPCCQRCETIYSNTTPRTSLGKAEELSCVRLHSYYLRGQGLGICTSWLTPWSDVLKLGYWRLLPNMMLVEFWANSSRGSSLFKGKLGFYKDWEYVVCLFFPLDWRKMTFSQTWICHTHDDEACSVYLMTSGPTVQVQTFFSVYTFLNWINILSTFYVSAAAEATMDSNKRLGPCAFGA